MAMGVSSQTAHTKNRHRRRMEHRPMSDINVTPMVDVMLVLLIVFMITAPLLTLGVQVNLPKAGGQNLPSQDTPLTISVNARGDIFIQDTEVSRADLVATLTAIAHGGRTQHIYVRGDENVNYGQIAGIVARITAAGFTRVALVTERSRE